MKKELAFIVIFTHLAYLTYSQKEVDFNIQYKASTRYSEALKQSSQTKVTFSGSEAFLRKLQENGTKNPVLKKIESVSETVINTGKLTDRMHFPITIKFTKSTDNDAKGDFPDGTIIYGQGYIGKTPTFDSISASGLRGDDKKAFLDGLTSLLSLSLFPQKRLKIGEVFSQDAPLSFPIEGVHVELLLTTTYKLVSILNKVASFDISQIYSSKPTVSKYKANAIGKGKGKLLYDVENNYYLSYQMDSDIQLHMQLENVNIAANSNDSFIRTATITRK